MGNTLLTAAILLLLISSGVTKEESPADKAQAYQKAVDIVADNINKATEKSQELVNKHMSAVDKDPGALITKEAMQRMMQSNSFLPQKAGTRSIVMEAQQGFNGISNYQPSSWKLTETMSGPVEKKPEPSSEKQPVYTYPVGLGPVLMNQCTAASYDKTSPCYNSKLFDLQNTICTKMMDAANYMGVGFDGRGFYRADSRRGSLIQRACAGRATFMGQDVPDTMNVYGIFETTAETKSFQSVDEYMSYIRDKAGLSEQKNLFTSEASKYSRASSVGVNLGGVGAIIGAGIGAYAGGPVGAAMGATLGGAIGGSISGGGGSGSGSESATDKGQSSSQFQQSDKSKQQQGAAQNFFAIMYVNVVLYEISLDDVKPTDINLAALRDYMSLPKSYFSVGADVKYQNFLLRWGTHYIRSGKFGGQLKITKTAKADKIQSAQEFASLAETEFQSMFASLQSKWSQESSSWGILGFGGESKSSSQSSGAKSESGYKGTLAATNQQSQAFRQSEFTQTTVEAQGGTPTIAEALVDFYTPQFKQLFHEWIESIKDYAKPFEFQLRPINQLFNLNMDTLFPAGNTDYGCMGGGSSNKADILVDPKTKKRYYIDTHTAVFNNITVVKKVRVYCPYSSIDEFKQDLESRIVSLERAVGIYMSEGPFPTSSFELQGGQPGCEEATLAQIHLFGPTTVPLKFSELLKQPFIIAFNLPESVPDIVTMQAKYIMTYRLDRWFAVEPNQELMNLYDGCQVANVRPFDKKVCFRNIILTYDEQEGLFSISKEDFEFSKQRNSLLPYWLSGTTIARSRKMFGPTSGDSTNIYEKKPDRAAIPCNVKWLNSHRLDPSKPENCIHFTAATEGDLFVIFASIPRDHTTWYYLQITPEGVNFHHAMSLHKSDHRKGMGLLGDKNLYQSFFVCVIQKSGTVTMQYGKADTDSEIGAVHAAYSYPPDSQFSVLSFYSFGSGIKTVSLMDVRLTKQMPAVACLGNEYIKKDGHCELDCHAECNGCTRARDNKACQQCKNLRVETRVGDIKTYECITQCPTSMHPSDKQTGLCELCSAGTFKANPGNEKCTPCAMGTSSPEGASRCGGCPAGTYTSSTGSQKCEKCPAGKYAAMGAATCIDCSVGTFAGEQGMGECHLCPHGHFGNSIGLSQCRECEAGFYADKRGMASCTSCPAGSWSSRGSASCANNCGFGEFSPQLGIACARCPAGSISESRGAISCIQCSVGTYQPISGESNCIICPKGAYVSTRGASAFVLCSPGTFNDLLGQTACRPCPPGSYAASAGAQACTPCPRGNFQPSGGQAACIQTSPGYYTDGEGQASQKSCPAGHFSATRGATGCTPCSAGQFASAGSSECGNCNEFQYAPAASGVCHDCPNNALVKSDKVNCYRKIFFDHIQPGPIFAPEHNVDKAVDGNRNTFYISQHDGQKVWQGSYGLRTEHIRKVVLWSRPDCCSDQFIGARVTIRYLRDPSFPVNHECGTVQKAARYVVFDCNIGRVTRIFVHRDTNPWMTLAEVEVYGD